MSEIKVGEYIRTKDDVIAKLVHVEDDIYYEFDNYLYREYEDEIDYLTAEQLHEYIKKHSFNIIDVIEEGDFVNRKEVYSIGTAIGNFPIINYKDGTFDIDSNINSVVTKEQFSKMRYKV